LRRFFALIRRVAAGPACFKEGKNVKREIKEVELENLNGGAALELFADEWRRVMENIIDPNTRPDAVREITLRIKVKPDKTRRAASTEISIGSKLQRVKPHESFIYFETREGKIKAYPDDPNQGTLDLDGDANIIPMPQAK
jgi:hypothetical protein